MPPILDAAIGTFFVFLLFSLVVSALNEYLLSLFDQRAKFLQEGLLELLGRSGSAPVVQPAGIMKYLHKGVQKADYWYEKSAGRIPLLKQAIQLVGWIFKSLLTLGGLFQPGASTRLMVGNKDLLKHGLLNGYSRSGNGTTASPSYIPAGAFVTALLDVVLGSNPGSVPTGALPAGTPGDNPVSHPAPDISKTLADILASIRNARLNSSSSGIHKDYHPVLDKIKTLAEFQAPNDLPDAESPLAGMLFEFRRLAVNEQARADAQAELLKAGTIPDAKAVIEAMNYDFKEELYGLAKAARADIGQFRASIASWFSVDDSLIRLERIAKCNPADPGQLAAAAIESKLGSLPNTQLGQSLLSLFLAAGRDMQKFKVGVEGWFNGVMDRVSGWYKRFTQKWTIALGFILAVVFNVDTLMVVRTLSNNPNLASAVAENAGVYVAENKRPLDRIELTALREKREKALDDAIKVRQELDPAASPDAVKKADAEVEQARADLNYLEDYRNAAAKLLNSGLPIGWTNESFNALRSTGMAALAMMITGWFLTAIAASLGAPFWFDLLSRFINIRAAGRPPGEKDVTSTPVQPPSTALNQTPGTQTVR